MAPKCPALYHIKRHQRNDLKIIPLIALLINSLRDIESMQELRLSLDYTLLRTVLPTILVLVPPLAAPPEVADADVMVCLNVRLIQIQ